MHCIGSRHSWGGARGEGVQARCRGRWQQHSIPFNTESLLCTNTRPMLGHDSPVGRGIKVLQPKGDLEVIQLIEVRRLCATLVFLTNFVSERNRKISALQHKTSTPNEDDGKDSISSPRLLRGFDFCGPLNTTHTFGTWQTTALAANHKTKFVFRF